MKTPRLVCARRNHFATKSMAAFAGMLLLLLTSTIAKADMPIGQVLTEEMIENQGDLAGLLGLAFGPDANSPLQFSSTVDFGGMTFSYSLNGGQTYLGMPLSLAASGTFDSMTNVMTLSATGSFGAQNFNVSGSDQVTFNNDGTVNSSPNLDFFVQAVKDYDAHGTITLYKDGTSIDEGYYTDKNGQKIPGSDYKDKDYWDVVSGQWGYNQNGTDSLPFYVGSSGFSPGDGGAGSFTTTVAPVPEPISLLLLGSGALGAFARMRSTPRA